MPALRDKTILILSPQAWGKMFLSKHHYAIELARRGNKVFFLNPPAQESGKAGITLMPSGVHENLFFIEHGLWFPYNLKFHLLWLFHFLMRGHVTKILAAIGEPVDIVWSFDLGNLYPLALFGKHPLKIFHPVDEPLNQLAIDSARGASVIFSVTREILEKYQAFDVPRQMINHGLSHEFLDGNGHASMAAPAPAAGTTGENSSHAGLRACLSGNLLRPDIDRDVLLEIVAGNPDVQFEFLGSYTGSQTNIGGSDDTAAAAFIKALQAKSNVRLHGVVDTPTLAAMIRGMDLFLICYDVRKDQSRGTNYHKIMEYLSTGKVIVSNNVTTYAGLPELVQMVEDREHNRRLPALFHTVARGLTIANSPELQQKRRAFAEDNTYHKQLDRIERFLEEKTGAR